MLETKRDLVKGGGETHDCATVFPREMILCEIIHPSNQVLIKAARNTGVRCSVVKSPLSLDLFKAGPVAICSAPILITLNVPTVFTFSTRWKSSRGCGPCLDRVRTAIPIPAQLTIALAVPNLSLRVRNAFWTSVSDVT